MNKQSILDSLDIPVFYSSELPGINWNGVDTTKTLCCFHVDSNPSLSINQQTGVFNCFACGAKGSIFDFAMKKHGLDFSGARALLAEKAGITGKSEPQRKLVAIYDYIGEAGALIFQAIRYEPKDFRQRRPDGKGGWIWNLQGVQLIPYNLPEVIKSDYAFIVEGEKDCDSLKKLGLVASCNAQGAGKWRSEYNTYFKGKRVIILPDNDKPGRDHALQVAKNLKGIAESVKVVELPGLKEKDDVSDWIVQGGTKEKLLEIVKETPIYQVSDYSDIGGRQLETSIKTTFSYLKRGADLKTLDIKIEWLVDKLLPKESITLLHGKGGIGKTWVCLILADCISRGLPFMGLDTQTLSVIFVDFENSLPVLCDRVRKIGIDDVLFWHNADTELKPPKLDKEDYMQYKALPPGSLLIFDTLRASQGQDENNSQAMALIMSRLKELRDMGFTILLLHHTPKGNDRTYKGSTAILDLADHVLSLHKVKKGNPEGREVEDEDDTECLYRLGTKDKTRYEPFHVFMSFDKVKGFVKAEDPAEEDLQTISDCIEGKLPLNQSQIYELVKDSPGLKGKGKVTGLLKKGEGKYWASYKEGKKLIYSTFQLSTPIYSQSGHMDNTLLQVSETERTDTLFDTPETLTGGHVSICPDIRQTDRTIDLESLLIGAEVIQ